MNKFLKLLILISIFLAIGISDCKRTPKQVQREYQKIIAPTPDQAQDQSKALTPVKWPGEVKNQQTIADDIFRKNFLVVFDISGSMSDRDCSGETNKIEAAKEALKIFANSVHDNDNLGLMTFNCKTQLLVPLATAKNNRAIFQQKVNAMEPDDGTCMDDAVRDGFTELTRQGKAQLGYGAYCLVMVTDGQANPGHDPTADINYVIDNTPIMVYGIGFCIKGDHPLNQKSRTVYREASNPAELTKALMDLLAESEQYKDL